MPLSIATWNVNSIRVRADAVLDWTREHRPDVLCLQEIKCLDEQFPRPDFEAMGYRVETWGQRTYNGVALLSLLPMEGVVRGLPDDDAQAQRRSIAATVGGIRVWNVYVPNGQSVGSEKYAYKLDWLRRNMSTRLRQRSREFYVASAPESGGLGKAARHVAGGRWGSHEARASS